MAFTKTTGTAATFTPTIVSPSPYNAGPFTYAWDFGDTSTSAVSAPSHTYTSVGMVTVSLVVTNTATGKTASSSQQGTILGGSLLANTLIAGRLDHRSILLDNGKVLITGGLTVYSGSGASATATCELYDPATQTFTSTGSMATARGSHELIKLPNGDILAVGGRDRNSGNAWYDVINVQPGTATATCEIYSVANGTWSATGSLATARRNFGLVYLPSGKIMALGGNNQSAYLSSTELYDVNAGTWSSGPAMPIAVSSFACEQLDDGTIFICGGAAGLNSFVGDTYIYTEGGSFVAKAALPGSITKCYPCWWHSGNTVIVAGGIGNDLDVTVHSYSVSGNSWTTLTALTSGSKGIAFGKATVGLFVAGGDAGADGYANTAVYLPTKTVLANLSANVRWANAVYIGNGNVLVTGGYTDGALLQTAYVYYVGV